MTVNLNNLLMKLPLASSAFLAYAVLGAIMLLSGSLEYGSYADNLLAVGIACGAIGVPRAVAKAAKGVQSVNFLGFVETLPIPTIVFVIFALVSTIALALNVIEYGAFTENLQKVGIACGVVQAARSAERVFAQ